MSEQFEAESEKAKGSRRSFFGWATMGAGLAASYGLGLAYFLRFLLPVRRERWRELFVATVDEIRPGQSRHFVDPAGGETFVHNLGGQFVALSNICPHLGCKVRYQAAESRFFCPCHNGVFDINGEPISGPPAQEGKALKRQEVIVRSGAVYIRWRQT
jgi:cytochrome b6-f complex iron-sulfur subunit